jgi:hypothetical protein
VKAEKTNESVLIKYETMFENDLNFFIDLFLLLLYMCWRPFKGAPVGGGSGLEGGRNTGGNRILRFFNSALGQLLFVNMYNTLKIYGKVKDVDSEMM